jgi:Flp pilus assembly protein TadG
MVDSGLESALMDTFAKTRPEDVTARQARWASPPLAGETGQSLVVVVLAMFVVIAMAAMAIDLSAWYQKHHEAQVSADAAALATANCEAQGKCNNTTGTQTAVNYVSTNSGVTIPSSDVTIANQTVTVRTPLPAPSFFAAAVSSAFGSSTQTATAKATWKTYGSDCTVTSGRCAFIFANDNSCSGIGASISTSGTAGVLNGTVISNSNITWGANGNPGGTAYATENVLCGGASGTSWANKTTYSVSAYWPNDWPINYANVYPACGPSLTYQCTGPYGTPSYCTDASNTGFGTGYTPFSGNQFYCAYGPTGTPSQPSTWNGTIVVDSSLSGDHTTFIGGTISIPSTITLSPYTGSNLLAYATGTGDPNPANCSSGTVDAFCLTGDGNSGNISGDVFVPNGGAYFNLGGNDNYTGFIQGYDVTYSSHGTDSGDGPTTSSAGGDPLPPEDMLTS